jgi:dihydroorotase
MLEFYSQKKISLPFIATKMCHNPARLFQIERRGFIREGYYADLVLVDPKSPQTVKKDNILYHCGWSPLEGVTFGSTIDKTWVSGHLAWQDGSFDESVKGHRLTFRRT